MSKRDQTPNHLRNVGATATVVLAAILAAAAGTDVEAEPPPTLNQQKDAIRKVGKAQNALNTRREEQKKLEEESKEFLSNVKEKIAVLDIAIQVLPEGYDKIKTILTNALDELKEKQEKWHQRLEAGEADLNKMKREFIKEFAEFRKVASPNDVANAFGIPREDGIDYGSFVTPEWLARTKGGKDGLPTILKTAEFGKNQTLGWLDESDTERSMTLTDATQHHFITTACMEQAYSDLSGDVKGRRPNVSRLPLNLNKHEQKPGPGDDRSTEIEKLRNGPWYNMVGNLAFPATAISNSTGWDDKELADTKHFDTQMEFLTRGEGTRTIDVDGVKVTYGLSPITRVHWNNASGNEGPKTRGDWDLPLVLGHVLNWGATAVPSQKDVKRRGEGDPVLEPYTSAGWADISAELDAWEKDGSPTRWQYIAKDIEEQICGKLCEISGIKGSGKNGVPTDEEWDKNNAIFKTRHAISEPNIQTRIESQAREFREGFCKYNGCTPDGIYLSIRGTSFTGPKGNGIMGHGYDIAPDTSLYQMLVATTAATRPILQRGTDSGEVLSDIPYAPGKTTGKPYSYTSTGHGEFVTRSLPNGAPNSSALMREYLEIMKRELKARIENRPTIKVGSGITERTETNGQPDHVQLEFRNFEKTTPTKEMEAINTQNREAVTKAFKEVETAYELKEIDAIAQHIRDGEYSEALAQLNEEVQKTNRFKISVLGDMAAPLGRMVGIPLITDPAIIHLDNAKKAVEKAENEFVVAYSFTVPPTTNLRISRITPYLQLRDPKADAPKITLISPDNSKVPVIMRDRPTPTSTNAELGTTTGFMLDPARGAVDLPKDQQGKWLMEISGKAATKGIRVGSEFGSRVFMWGESLDPGNRSVVETIIPLIKERAANASKLPASNVLKIDDASVRLHLMDGAETFPTEEDHNRKLTPPTAKERHKYIQEFFETSPLIKTLHEKGIIKGLKVEAISPPEETHKVGRIDNSKSWQQGIMEAATEIHALYVKAQELSGGHLQKNLDPDWRTLALAAASGGIPHGDHPRGGESIHERLVGYREFDRLERIKQSRRDQTRLT